MVCWGDKGDAKIVSQCYAVGSCSKANCWRLNPLRENAGVGQAVSLGVTTRMVAIGGAYSEAATAKRNGI